MNKKRLPIFKFLLPVAGLILLFLIVQQVVKRFKNPNQMDIVRSMTMEMAVKMPSGAMPVEMEKVVAGPFQTVVTYTGTADAYNETPVFPRVEGWIKALPVYSGDRVKKGQLLARLDSLELSSRVKEALYEREAARKAHLGSQKLKDEAGAHKDHYKHSIQEVKANLDYWTAEIERSRHLLKDDVISQEEFDRELADFKAAESRYHQMTANSEAALKAYEAAQFQVESAKDLVTKASAGLGTQEIIQSYTSVLSPISGVVMDRKFDVGILVKPDMEIMRIAQISPIRIQANVPMEVLKKIKIGIPVTVWLDKLQTREPINAKVTSVFAMTDPATRTTRVEALVSNEDRKILPGDFVTVDFHVGTKSAALTVAKTAVVEKDQQKAVWVVKEGKAQLRYVTTSGTNGKRIAITAGLQPGEEVINRGNRDLRVGDMVVSAPYSAEGVAELPKASAASNKLGEANNYQIKRTLEHLVVSVQLVTSPAKVGANKLKIELTPMHGSLPSNISVELNSEMPAMSSMTVPKPRVKKLTSESFEAEAEFIMPGTWQLDVAIKEGAKTVGTIELLVEADK